VIDIIDRIEDARITVSARARDASDSEVYAVLVDAAKEIERLREKCDRQAMILRRLNADKHPDTYFISGESGNKDQNGMPKHIWVVPEYGVDWHMVYERTEIASGPGW
jgi:hypothetical protein